MTTYIESKAIGDGTYDHSEVIEAHKNGAKVNFLLQNMDDMRDIWGFINDPGWSPIVKYRAVIEETHQEMIKRCDDETELCWLIRQKFQSGNTIPVERITLTRAEVNEVFPGLLK